MQLYRVRNFAEWQAHRERSAALQQQRREIEQQLQAAAKSDTTLPGYSYTAAQACEFRVDWPTSEEQAINWRETLHCPGTGLINRVRAAVHLFEQECAPYPDDAIYLTEQKTGLYQFMQKRYPNSVGSEFLGDSVKPGQTNLRGIRNEDLTRLSFGDASLHAILSFDCLEHVPDYRKALAECARVLKPGGTLLWSVPFAAVSDTNIVRALQHSDGSIEHLLEPEYHGDPNSKEGCLCFYHFGWEMLRDALQAGFSDSYALLYWSRELGYLGGEQIMFVAKV